MALNEEWFEPGLFPSPFLIFFREKKAKFKHGESLRHKNRRQLFCFLEQSPPKDDSVTPFSKESDCCREPSQSLDYVSPNLF